MITTVAKLFLATQHEKEEEWLNLMSSQGKAMERYIFPCFYKFKDCEPNEYTYRIQLLDNLPYSSKSREYIEFLKDTDIEVVDTYLKWVYFKKKTKDGLFNLFSNLESQIKHYKRIFKFLFPVMILEIAGACINVNLYIYEGYSVHRPMAQLMIFLALLLVVLESSVLIKIHKLKKENLIRE